MIKDAWNAEAEIAASPRVELGHYSTNLAMRLAKQAGKNPFVLAQELARELREKAPQGFFEKVEAMPPGFVNLWLAPQVLQRELARVLKEKKKYGRSKKGAGRRVIVEYVSPNIAKPLHVGQLRNLVTGDALAKLHEALGYKVVRWNYVGDWGTQFGKLIAAYKQWGKKEEIKRNPIQALLGLYIKFNEAIKEDPELEARGRAEFRKLEKGDKENRRIWTWFRKESLRENTRLFRKLGVKFDVEIGESHYEKELQGVVDELIRRGLASPSEGALVVHLDQFGLPPALVQKSDGTSLYLTRDIANLKYRLAKHKPAKILYVVGNEQSLAFAQLFAIAHLLGLDQAELIHVKYGLVLAAGGQKFSTRAGRIVTAEDVISEAEGRARAVVEEKNPKLAAREKARIAQAVGIGALKFANLRENRGSDIVFDWERMMSFSGDSGPYLQYTYARFRSILRKAGSASWRIWRASASRRTELLTGAEELRIVRKLAQLAEVLEEAAANYAPNLVVSYLIELANLANRYYEATPILKDADKKRRNARLLLIQGVAQVLANGLEILGMQAPEKI